MITREEVLFHETFGAIFNEYASGLLVYEPKGKKEMFIISESTTQEELLELQIKSLNDNFDYVYELVKNNKQFVYEPGMIY